MIVFDREAFKKLVGEIAGGPDAAQEIKAIVLSYITYANENEVNEMSEYPDELSKL